MNRVAVFVRPQLRALVFVGALLSVFVLFTSTSDGAGPAAPVTYTVTYDPPGAEPPVTIVENGRVGHTARIDLVGTGKADVLATFEILDSGPARLVVERAVPKRGSANALPLAIVATAATPQSGAGTVSVGYDALASSAPTRFQGDFDVQSATAVDFATVSPGATLEVLGSSPAGAGSATFQPVPAAAHVSMRAGAASAVVGVTSAGGASVDVHAEAGGVTLDATIGDAPASLALDISDQGSQGKAAAYHGASPGADVTASLRETSGQSVAQEVLLTLQNASTDVVISQPAPGSIDVSGAAELVDAAFARGGEAQRVNPAFAPGGAQYITAGGVSSTAVRLPNVTSASAQLGPDVSYTGSAQAGPLRLLLEAGGRSIDVRVDDAPSSLDFEFSPESGRLAHAASAPIGQIRIAAADPDGLFGRATELDLAATSLPTALTLDVTQAGDSVSVDAHGQEVGSVEFMATNGPSVTIPASRDSLELHDDGSSYLFAGRLTGLRRATADIAPDPQLFVDTTGNRVFEANLDARDGSENVYLRATLDPVKSATSLTVSSVDDGSRLLYSAAAAADSLSLSTNGDDETDFVDLTLVPVPASVDLCWSEGAACTSSGGAANAGTVRLNASEPVTVNLFECALPLMGCTSANTFSSTELTNLRARLLGLDTNVNGPPIVSSGNRVFFDTDNHELSGDIHRRLDNPLVQRLDLHVPSGFRAQDRLATWGPPSFINPSGISRSGTITCPAGTAFDVRLAALVAVDLDSILC